MSQAHAPISITVGAKNAHALKFRALVVASVVSLSCLLPGVSHAAPTFSALQVQLPAGVIEGESTQVKGTDVRTFKGIPYAAPPVGALRWKEPELVTRWPGVRETKQFGPRCMQLDLFDSTYRSNSMSEDCLYLNVWTRARPGERLPVMVYFHGGGFSAGDGSEPRYDGANMAARGIVTVTVNYRLGVFGFLAHPDLARESPHSATGNYGMLDQVRALKWVRRNIERFGGDPAQVTIAGQTAGALSVNAHMASPLSHDLFARAISESGTAFAPEIVWKREVAEANAVRFARGLGATSLETMRALPAQTLLDATGSRQHPDWWFWPIVDGYFLSKMPEAVFVAGAQSRVPLLLGSNSEEVPYTKMLKGTEPTPENWRAFLNRLFFLRGVQRGDEAFALYPGHNNEEVIRSAMALASDIGINSRLWHWIALHRAADLPVYFYQYTHPLPPKRGAPPNTQRAIGAAYDAQVAYALGNLDNEPSYAWTADDREVSRIFSGYIERFVKTGDPYNPYLPPWLVVRGDENLTRQTIGTHTRMEIAREAARIALVESYQNSVDTDFNFALPDVTD